MLAAGEDSSIAPEPSQVIDTPAEPSKVLSSGSYDEHPRHHMVTRAINDRMKRMPVDGARSMQSKVTPDHQFCRLFCDGRAGHAALSDEVCVACRFRMDLNHSDLEFGQR